jgi:threonine synthase
MKYTMKCSKCGKLYTDQDRAYWCVCGGKLDIQMNIADVELDIEELIRRDVSQLPIIEKYFELMPLHERKVVSLGEGGTRLLRSKRLAEDTGLNLYIKNETTNPTGSFKDRPITVGLNKAIEHGASAVATASSGNAAAALSAGAAKSGMRCITFVPEDIPKSKAAQLQFYGADVYRCKRTSDEDPTAVCLKQICEQREDVIPVPSFGTFNPYQIEGAKSLAYEVAEQKLPEHIVIPVGGAGLLLGTWKGFSEFHSLGTSRLLAARPSCVPSKRASQYGYGRMQAQWQMVWQTRSHGTATRRWWGCGRLAPLRWQSRMQRYCPRRGSWPSWKEYLRSRLAWCRWPVRFR